MKPVRALRAAAEVLLAPASVARAALDSPQAAAEHPASRQLASLLDEGFEVVSCERRRSPRVTEVVVRRGETTRAVSSGDLAFAVFAADPARTRATRDPRTSQA